VCIKCEGRRGEEREGEVHNRRVSKRVSRFGDRGGTLVTPDVNHITSESCHDGGFPMDGTLIQTTHSLLGHIIHYS